MLVFLFSFGVLGLTLTHRDSLSEVHLQQFVVACQAHTISLKDHAINKLSPNGSLRPLGIPEPGRLPEE